MVSPQISAHKTIKAIICGLGDRAYMTTKEEAFAAPLAFVDVGAFYDDYNGECPQVIQKNI